MSNGWTCPDCQSYISTPKSEDLGDAVANHVCPSPDDPPIHGATWLW